MKLLFVTTEIDRGSIAKLKKQWMKKINNIRNKLTRNPTFNSYKGSIICKLK